MIEKLECLYRTQDIMCPYCEAIQSSDMKYEEIQGVEGEHVVECCDCEKEFKVELYIEFNYSSEPMEGWSEE